MVFVHAAPSLCVHWVFKHEHALAGQQAAATLSWLFCGQRDPLRVWRRVCSGLMLAAPRQDEWHAGRQHPTFCWFSEGCNRCTPANVDPATSTILASCLVCMRSSLDEGKLASPRRGAHAQAREKETRLIDENGLLALIDAARTDDAPGPASAPAGARTEPLFFNKEDTMCSKKMQCVKRAPCPRFLCLLPT